MDTQEDMVNEYDGNIISITLFGMVPGISRARGLEK